MHLPSITRITQQAHKTVGGKFINQLMPGDNCSPQ